MEDFNAFDQPQIKVADFGFATFFSDDNEDHLMSARLGTRTYMAPELTLGKKYDEKVDVWAAGVITFFLLTQGSFPFSAGEYDFDELSKKIQTKEPNWNVFNQHGHSAQAKSFIKQCLTKDPKKRPTAKELLDHDWISGALKTVDNVAAKNRIYRNIV